MIVDFNSSQKIDNRPINTTESIFQTPDKINRRSFFEIFCWTTYFTNSIILRNDLKKNLIIKDKVIGVFFEN